MSETDILIAMQDAVRKALVTTANKEIEKQKHKFECGMGKKKNEIIGKLINEIKNRCKARVKRRSIYYPNCSVGKMR